jgi:hypothetical protein
MAAAIARSNHRGTGTVLANEKRPEGRLAISGVRYGVSPHRD